MTGMTGKDMFEFGGELYEDDEEGYDEDWDISRMLARYVSGHGVGGGGHPLDSLRLLFFIVSDLVGQIRVLICCGTRGKCADSSQREDESRPEGYDDQPDAGVRGDDEDGVDEATAAVNGLAVDAKA